MWAFAWAVSRHPKHCRNLADKKDKGFSWDNDILYKTVLDDIWGK